MKQLIDIATWERKDHFHFFHAFDEPFFGVTVNIDCTKAYQAAKANQVSFFLYYLHASLTAVNSIDAFKLRIADDQVWKYDVVNASPTINRPDGTFGFAYVDFHKDINEFIRQAQMEIERVQHSTGLVPALSGENVIHYSSIPWISFTALTHARSFSHRDSIPKISFGKMEEVNGRRSMPMSVHGHHGLMDGFHAGQYIEQLQDLLNA